MTNTEKMALIKLVYNAIFTSKFNNTNIAESIIRHPNIVGGIKKGRWFVNGTLRGFDLDIEDAGKMLYLRFLEQNPNKRDNFGNLKPNAVLAQAGHKIMWLIDQTKQNGFLGKVQDDEWIPSEQRAYTQVNSNSPANTPMAQDQLAGIPELSHNAGIPEYVINQFEETEIDSYEEVIEDYDRDMD